MTRSSARLGGLLLAILLVGCNSLSGGTSANAPVGPSRLLISSSPALLPLLHAATALFARQHPQAQITIQTGESPDALSALSQRQVNLAATALYADPVAATAQIFEQLLCVIPFSIIVHPGVSLTSLSQEQVLRIFSTGEITNWKQIGGPDQKLVVLIPPATSDLRRLFREEVLGDATEVGTVLPSDSPETLYQTVADTPGSISYLPAPLLAAGVRAVAIDGEPASAHPIASGHYAFWSFAHLYSRDAPAPDEDEIGEEEDVSALFLHFMQTPAAAQLIQQLGYIPLAQMTLPPMVVPSSAAIRSP